MAGISLILQNNPTVRQINCGTSSPKLGGTINLSAFPNLQDFRCNNNDITAISGYAQNSNLKTLQFFNNKVTGSLPSLSDNTGLIFFSCATNLLTGPIPSLSGLSKFERGSRLRDRGQKTNKINVFRVLSEFFPIVTNFINVKIFFENSRRPLKALKVFFLTKR